MPPIPQVAVIIVATAIAISLLILDFILVEVFSNPLVYLFSLLLAFLLGAITLRILLKILKKVDEWIE